MIYHPSHLQVGGGVQVVSGGKKVRQECMKEKEKEKCMKNKNVWVREWVRCVVSMGERTDPTPIPSIDHP